MDPSITAPPAHWGTEPLRLNSLGRPRAGVLWTDLRCEDGAEGEAALGAARALALEALSRAPEKVVLAACLPEPAQVPHVFFEMRHTMLLDRYRLSLGGPGHDALRAAVEAQDPDARFEYDFRPSYALDARADELWATVGKLELLSPVRDRARLSGRYLERPGRAYRFLSNEMFGRLAALSVCREDGDEVQMLELLSRDKQILSGMELCLRVADHYRAEGRRALVFVGKDAWYFGAVLQHFERRPDPARPFFTRAADPSLSHVYENAANWTVTLGDALDP